VINTLLNGKGAPSKSIGIDGDFYIDTRSLLISGPKTKGKWPTARSMQGANGVNGSNGADGRNGNDAKSVTTASTVSGPVGPQGQTGAKGADGANGGTGPAGATGPVGATGSGSAGSQGAAGSNGSNGSPGSTGLTGARGETGTVGPTEITVITIPTWTLQTATEFGSSTSSGFGILKAGKSYQISILLWGTTTSLNSSYGIELLSSTGTAPSYFYTAAALKYAVGSSISNKYGFSILGTITVGEADVSLSIKVIDGAGDTTGKPMVMTGMAHITLIGQLK
jgi:hypothetical protein